MIEERLDRIEKKLDMLLEAQRNKIPKKKYMTAREVEELIGINHRTLLNRSNLPRWEKRFIPSLKLKGSNRKFFERKVIERLFKLA